MIKSDNVSFISNVNGLTRRILLLSEKLQFESINDLSFYDLKLFLGKKKILIDDYISVYNLFKLFLILILGKKKELIVYSFEVYYIDLSSYSFFSKFNTFKIFLGGLIKCIILRTFIKLYSKKIIVCSELRKKYIEKIYTDQEVLFINNRVYKNDNFSLEEIKEKNFFFIAGSINNEIDFEKLCLFCKKENYKLVIAAKINNKKIIYKYSDIIISKENINKDKVFSYINKASACACFYNNDTINQKYAASIKLYEYMLYNKKIIVSNNDGSLSALKNNNYKKYIEVNKLNIDNLKALENYPDIKVITYEEELSSFKI